jgi:hypothetical protein
VLAQTVARTPANCLPPNEWHRIVWRWLQAQPADKRRQLRATRHLAWQSAWRRVVEQETARRLVLESTSHPPATPPEWVETVPDTFLAYILRPVMDQ